MPPNPAKEAEYAELHERKLFGILTFLGQISMKIFFVSVFKGKILSNELFFTVMLKVSRHTNHMVV